MDTSIRQATKQIKAAEAAFAKSRNVSPATRVAWLEATASSLEKHSNELVTLAQKTTHLGEGRLRGELKRSVFQLRLFADEITTGENLAATIDHADPAWGTGPRPDIRRVNVPLGVVGVFGASNFPFAFSVMGGDSSSALAAGCAVVHKIHEGHLDLGVRTGEIVAQALAAAGAPAGLFSVITGREAAEALVDHPLIKAIGFTGSTVGGRALFDRAARRPNPIPFYGELGSINPVFVTEKAWNVRRDQILVQYASSFTLGMGQFCTKPGLLFAPATESDELRRVLSPELDGKELAPLLSPKLRAGFDAARAKISGAQGVNAIIAGDEGEEPRPTVFRTSTADVRSRPDLLQEEMFGPATLIVEYESEAELAELASLIEGQLTTTIQAEPDEDLTDLLAVLREKCGRILWNAWPTGVTVTYAQQHGGPYPASTAAGATSVGTAAISRFMRPVAYDSFPPAQLPEPLQDHNPWGIARRVDGRWDRTNETTSNIAGRKL